MSYAQIVAQQMSLRQQAAENRRLREEEEKKAKAQKWAALGNILGTGVGAGIGAAAGRGEGAILGAGVGGDIGQTIAGLSTGKYGAEHALSGAQGIAQKTPELIAAPVNRRRELQSILGTDTGKRALTDVLGTEDQGLASDFRRSMGLEGQNPLMPRTNREMRRVARDHGPAIAARQQEILGQEVNRATIDAARAKAAVDFEKEDRDDIRKRNEFLADKAFKLKDDFRKMTGDYWVRADKLAQLKTFKDANSGAGDVIGLYGLIQFLEPGFAVRNDDKEVLQAAFGKVRAAVANIKGEFTAARDAILDLLDSWNDPSLSEAKKKEIAEKAKAGARQIEGGTPGALFLTPEDRETLYGLAVDLAYNDTKRVTQAVNYFREGQMKDLNQRFVREGVRPLTMDVVDDQFRAAVERFQELGIEIGRDENSGLWYVKQPKKKGEKPVASAATTVEPVPTTNVNSQGIAVTTDESGNRKVTRGGREIVIKPIEGPE